MSYMENLSLFFALVFGIIIVPGMDMVFVMASSLTGGRASGLAATAGTMAGAAVHAIYATLGVGLLTTLVPSLFNGLLLAGALYIAWIGLSLLRSTIAIGSVGTVERVSHWVSFRRGATSCLLNPKSYLFMLAVYPQFLKAEYGPFWLQALVLTLITAACQLAVYGSLALAAGRSRDWLVASPGTTANLSRAIGALLIAVAGFTAWEGWMVA
ncbi:LysE family translocator [Pararhizobium sp.]|uniref:LysE family translocator n=1 Tax=Pararhizobium sp. TaxID=1977563 RepID=UPI00271BE8ED|nr:LysE family translocator [Pararhizobium sp.]MDO9417266.1 LysE family translocator [Pararhizobium sp.]